MKRTILFTFLLFISFLTVKAQNIEAVITGIRSTQGQFVIKVYKDDNSFQDDKPFQTLKFKKNAISKGEMTVKFSLDPGTYGLALLDDENNDGEMNYSFFGIPEEGFGFSNYYLSGFSKPKFDSFSFVVNKNQKQKIIIKIRYM